MARMIDGDKLMELFKEQYLCNKSMKHREEARAWQGAIQLLYDMPTLTQPNETPPCYQPDGDGCAYQCYDGDDEPIDKCKECPLCYSDKQRHRTTLNEPLTLKELRQMDGKPVWVEDVDHWALIDIEKGGEWDGVPFAIWTENGVNFCYNVMDRNLLCYRHPPEGEEEEKHVIEITENL